MSSNQSGARLSRTWLSSVHAGVTKSAFNSIHQEWGGERLGKDLMIEARADDGVVEAIRGDVAERLKAGVTFQFLDLSAKAVTDKIDIRQARNQLGRATSAMTSTMSASVVARE